MELVKNSLFKESLCLPLYLQDPREKLILSLKKEIKVLRNENHYLRQQVSECTKYTVHSIYNVTFGIHRNGPCYVIKGQF